ncbi:MAG: divalent-cation tolerance protein CutA [Pseudomonadota bacterium]
MSIAITINCPSPEVAETIAAGLMDQRLVACANIYPAIQSRYFWKGKIETATEIPLLVKTRKALFPEVAEAVRALHPYETPSIVATDIVRANTDYIAWIDAETIAPGGRAARGA